MTGTIDRIVEGLMPHTGGALTNQIIVVDDDARLVDIYSQYITGIDDGLIVHGFTDRRTAIGWIDEYYKGLSEGKPVAGPLSIAFLDIVMPQGPGLAEIVDAIRKHDSDVLIVAMSAHPDWSDHVKLDFFRKNTHGMTKPQNRDEWKKVIDEYLQGFYTQYHLRLTSAINQLKSAARLFLDLDTDGHARDRAETRELARFYQMGANDMLSSLVFEGYPDIVRTMHNSNLLMLYFTDEGKAYALKRTRNPGFSKVEFSATEKLRQYQETRKGSQSAGYFPKLLSPISYSDNFLLMEAEHVVTWDDFFRLLNESKDVNADYSYALKKKILETRTSVFAQILSIPSGFEAKEFYYAEKFRQSIKTIEESGQPFPDGFGIEDAVCDMKSIQESANVPFWDLSNSNGGIFLEGALKLMEKKGLFDPHDYSHETQQRVLREAAKDFSHVMKAYNASLHAVNLMEIACEFDWEKTQYHIHPCHEIIQTVQHPEVKLLPEDEKAIVNKFIDSCIESGILIEKPQPKELILIEMYHHSRRAYYLMKEHEVDAGIAGIDADPKQEALKYHLDRLDKAIMAYMGRS